MPSRYEDVGEQSWDESPGDGRRAGAHRPQGSVASTGPTLPPVTGAPEEIARNAARTLMSGRRLDTGTLAAELGISRATLFRRAGNRDAILGDAPTGCARWP